MKHLNRIIVLLSMTIIQLGCKKAIEVDPPFTSLNAGNVYTTDATAAAVLTDVYAEMSAQNINQQAGYISSISFYAGLGSDELTLFNLTSQFPLMYYSNDLTKTSQLNFWNSIYPQIFIVNNAIDGLNASSKLTSSVKQQLLGEAKFIRAFCYFYLVNMYGNVPLVLSVDWKVNALLPCSSKDQIFQQIISDLKDAKESLSSNYLKGDALTPYGAGTEERVRPTKWAAAALLARAYLYNGEWANAELEAGTVINNASIFSIIPLNGVFIKNSKETIWSLQPVGNNANSNSGEGKIFLLPSTGPNTVSYPVYLNSYVVNAFEAGDQRKTNWVDSTKPASIAYYYPKKYKIGNVITTTQEYPIILRLAEQYLIRAESRAQQDNISGAQTDLNMIRTRAGLPNTTASSQLSLLNAIAHERQVELFTEWGHRWFDLKRTNKIDSVMTIICPTKGGTWNQYKSLYPIPQTDIDQNPNLVQNQGY